MMQNNEAAMREAVSKKIYSYIGLAQKAGKAAAGEFLTEKAIQERKAELVLVSEEASANTKKLFTDKCNYRNIPIFYYGEKEALGKAIGKQMRTSIAITDPGMAANIAKHLEDRKEDGGK